MRYVTLFLLAAALCGCATLTTVRDDGTNVTYAGDAHGVVEILRATDPRPYELAESAVSLAGEAVNKGMPATFTRDPRGGVRVSAGYSSPYMGMLGGGFQAGNTVYVPGQGLVPVGAMPSRLPPLAIGRAGGGGTGFVPNKDSCKEPSTMEAHAVCGDWRSRQAVEAIKAFHP